MILIRRRGDFMKKTKLLAAALAVVLVLSGCSDRANSSALSDIEGSSEGVQDSRSDTSGKDRDDSHGGGGGASGTVSGVSENSEEDPQEKNESNSSAEKVPEKTDNDDDGTDAVSHATKGESGEDSPNKSEENKSESKANEMTVSVNGKEFSAKFYDTKAAEEFKAMLPLTLDMTELNGNEKYFYLDGRLTAESERIGSIKRGDIMLYGANCVVLFYESFSTPYSYTRIGYIENSEGLEKAVGTGNVTVEFK